MRNWQWLAALFGTGAVCLFLGFLGGSATLPAAPGPAPAQEAMASSPDDPVVEAGSGKTAGNPGERETATTGAAGESQPDQPVTRPGSAAPWVELLKQIPFNPPPVGDGIITGVVVDMAGNPLRGATVRPTRLLDPPQSTRLLAYDYTNRPFWRGIVDDVQTLVKMRHEYSGETQAATTDANGRFALNGLASVEYFLRTSLDGYVFDTSSGSQYARPGMDVRLVGARRHKLLVEVLTESGQHVQPGMVQVRAIHRSDGSFMAAMNQSSPFEYHVPAGAYTISARASDPPATAPTQVVTTTGDESRVVLHLKDAPCIWGRTVQQGGRLTGGVRTVAIPLAPGQDARAELLKQAARSPDGSGASYIIASPAPGRHAAGFFHGTHLLHVEEYEYTAGVLRRDVILSPPPAQAAIVCRFRDAHPGASTRAQFNAHLGGPSPHQIGLVAWFITMDEFRIIPPEIPAEAVPQRIEVDAREYGRAEVPVSNLQPQTLALQFQQLVSVVVDLGGWRSPAGVSTEIEIRRDDGTRLASSSPHGAPDLIVIPRVPKGRHTLYIGVTSPHRLALFVQSIEIAGESVVLPVQLPALHKVTLEVQPKDAGPIELSSDTTAAPFRTSIHVPNNRTIVVNGLPHGTYTCSYTVRTTNQKREITFSVPAPNPVVLPE